MKSIFLDRTYWLFVLIAALPPVLFGSRDPLLTWIPIGPIAIAWLLTSSQMNIWNRVALCYGIGFGVQFLTGIVNAVVNTGVLGWQMLLLAPVIIYFSSRPGRRPQPIGKVIIVAIVVALVSGVLEAILQPLNVQQLQLRDPRFVELTLLGKIVDRALVAPPFFLLYGASLYLAFKTRIQEPPKSVVSKEGAA